MALLTMPSDYVAGTISLTNGSIDFTGTGTAWQLVGLKEGDLLIDVEGATQFWALIDEITSNIAGTLTRPWAGPDLVDVQYRMRFTSDGTRSTAQAAMLRQDLSNGRVQAIATASGVSGVLEYLPGGAAQLVPKTDLISGAAYDVQVADIAARAAYDGQFGPTPQRGGFAVLVADTGNGRSAIYSKASNASGDWSDPAYVTGPSINLAVTEVDEVPYGTPPDVTLTPRAGGYNLAFELPRGMMIQPGTTTTLAPDQPAAVTFVPVTGGYRLDIAIPRGPTGDIDGLTPFWVSRLGADTTQAQALAGLGAQAAGDYEPARTRATSTENTAGTGTTVRGQAPADVRQNALAAVLASFTQSLGAQVIWTKLPNGMILQAGSTVLTTNSSGDYTIILPVTYPNYNTGALVCNGDSNTNPSRHDVVSLVRGQIVGRAGGALSTAIRVNWLSWGY